jgi:predicted nucleic acid-binding protein
VVILLWDASALVKVCSTEIGSDSASVLFKKRVGAVNVATSIGYVEAVAALARKRNRGELGIASFREALAFLKAEVLDNPDFIFLSLQDPAFLAGLDLILRHGINATDAAILGVYLRYTGARRLLGDSGVLVASDARLLRAARSEGLDAIDPETVEPAEAEAILSR